MNSTGNGKAASERAIALGARLLRQRCQGEPAFPSTPSEEARARRECQSSSTMLRQERRLEEFPQAGSRAIVVNARYLRQRETGVQRYARQISARLPNLRAVAPARMGRGPAGHLWEQAVLPFEVGRSLLWSPSNTGPLAVRRQVLTVHDCSFVDWPEGFSAAFAAWYRWLVPRLVRRVRQVITVSEFSRRRLLELTAVAEDRVVAIPNGVDPRFRPADPDAIRAVRARLGLPERYALCVGSLEPRKNLAGLLEAWRLLPGRHAGVGLVMVGATSHVFRQVELDAARAGCGARRTGCFGSSNLHVTGYVPDADLPPLYSGAELFVYPSLYEGFGLPVLEAMACGAPVVCSNNTALPEVAGEAAILVDPREPESVAEGIRSVLDDAATRDGLRRRGWERSQRFRWEDAAARVWQVLVQALEQE